MGAGSVSNNPLVNVVPGADQPSTIDKVQTGANNIHQTTKAAVEGQGFKTLSIVSWGRRIVSKLGIAGYPVTLLLSPVLLPLSFLYDGYRCVRLLSRKITNFETPVQKLLPMTAQHAEDAAKLKQVKETLYSKNAELSDEVAARKIEAGELYSAKAHADQRLVQLQQQNNHLGYQLAQQQNDNANVAARAENAERQTVALKGQVANLQQEKGQSDHQMAKLKKDLADAAEQFNRERSELALKLQQSQAASHVKLADKELHIHQITEELKEARNALRTMADCDRESQQKLQRKITELEQDLEACRVQMVTQAEAESRISGLQQQLEDSKASAERLKEGFEDEQKKLKAVLAQQIGECQQLETRLHKTKQAVKNIIKDRAAQKERLQQTRDTLHQTEQTVIKFGRENKRLKAESTQLKENDSTLADTREQLAELSQHLQQLKLNNTELSQDNERIQESKGLAKQFIEDKEPEIARLTEQLQKVEETLNRWQSMKAIENETFQALPDRKKELIAVLLEEHVIEERIVLEKGDEYFLECTRNLHYSERELKKRLEEKERIIREGGVAGVESAAMASLEYVLTKERSKQPDIHTVKEMAKRRLIDGARAEEDLAMAKTEISYHEKEKDELLELSVRLGWSNDELTRENPLLQSRSKDLEAQLEFHLQSVHDQMQSDYTQMESQIFAQQLKDRPLSNPQQNGYGDALETSVKH